ncbi:MAG: hypothetical protein JXA42_01645 [Anaerolineales bacterium]|nr:hypothetical protein [Anaerolineales bacterium]
MGNGISQALGIGLGFVLTLMVYSYLLGDNPLYRLAIHLLVGIGMGYATIIVLYNVVIPQLISPITQVLSGSTADAGALAQPFVWLLAALMFLKMFPKTAQFGNITMGFVIGVGSAVAIGGALLGTLIPQIRASALPLLPGSALSILPGQSGSINALASLVVITGTITSLLYFHFHAQSVGENKVERPAWLRATSQIGQVFLMIAFGSLYAGALVSSLSVLTERIQFLISAPGELFRLF